MYGFRSHDMQKNDRFKALYPRVDVDCLHVAQKSSGRGLFSIYDTIQLEKGSLHFHFAT